MNIKNIKEIIHRSASKYLTKVNTDATAFH